MPLGQLESVLALQGIRHVVAFDQFIGVVEQHANIRSAFDIGEPDYFSSTDSLRPHATASDSSFV